MSKAIHKLLLLLLMPVLAIAQPNSDFTSNIVDGCVPIPVQFNSHSSVQDSTKFTHSWNLGGTSSTKVNPSTTFTTAGTYTITHTVSGPGGSNTTTKTNYITVYPKPSANFSATPLVGCPPLNVTFTDQSNLGIAGNGTYFWDFGDGSNSTLKNPTHIYTTGPNTVTLTVKNSKGCPDFISKTAYIDVYTPPVVSFSANKREFCSAPGTVNFTSNATGSGTLTYDWDFGDGSAPGTSANPTHTYTGPAPKSYNVSLTVTDGNGCKTTYSQNGFIVIQKAIATFTGPSSLCLGETANFTNTSPTGLTTQTWDFGDGNTSTAKNPSHVYGSAGTYTVKLTSYFGGCPATTTKTITIRPRPDVSFYIDPDTLCPAPQTVQFFANNTFTNYTWWFGDGNFSNQQSPTHTYTQNGQYTVKFRGTDQYGCTDSLTLVNHVKIFPLYIDAFADVYNGCKPLTVNFDVNIYRDSNLLYPYVPAKYRWDFGNGDTSLLQMPQYTFTDTGVYRVIVDVETIQGCKISDTLEIKVGDMPTACFTANPLVICNNDSVKFTNCSTGGPPLSAFWDFGDGGTSGDWSPTYYYRNSGKHTVTLTVEHYGCIDTHQIINYVHVLEPDADIEGGKDCLNALRYNFKDSSIGADSVFWMFGDGNTSSIHHPSHVYSTAGSYNVTLIAYNFTTGCNDTDRIQIYVGPNAPDFWTNKQRLCIGDSVQFKGIMTGDSSSAVFDWYFNNALIGKDLDSFNFTFLAPGQYTVKMVAFHDGCMDSVTKVNWITVGKPIAGFKTDTTHFCMPDSVTFVDTSYGSPGTTIASRYWDFGNGNTLTTTNTTVKELYSSKGIYGVTLIITDDIGCKTTVVKPGHIHAQKPDAKFVVKSPACVGEQLEFANISIDKHFDEWAFGDGNTSKADTAYHSYTTRGSFNPRLIVTDSLGCKDTMVYQSVVTTQPQASFNMSDSISICPNLVVNFTNTSLRYQSSRWDFGNGNKSTIPNPTASFVNPNQYTVKLIVTDSLGCKDSTTRNVQILGYSGAFSYDTSEGCAPLTVKFTSQVQGRVPSMLWDFNDGTTQQIGQSGTVTYTYQSPGKYLPKMIFNDGLGCNAVSDGPDTIYVDGVDIDFETGPACAYSNVDFVNKSKSYFSSIKSTHWEFHDGSFSALTDPSKTYGASGDYKVILRIENQRGCKDTLEKNITVYDPLAVDAGPDSTICITDSVMLMPSGGVTYEWSPGATLTCTNCENPLAFPTTKSKYVVISTDINGCHDTDDVWIDIKTHVTSKVGEGGEICEGDTFNLYVEGANRYLWSPSESLNNSNIDTPIAIPGATTSYRVIAYEGRCIPDTNYVDVTVHPKPTVKARGEATIVAGSSTDLSASGKHIATFEWTPSESLSCTECPNPIANPYKTTVYTVRVFSDFGCINSDEVKVTVLCDESQIFIPNTFTPNGDGVNDIFYVRGEGISDVKTFRIYNRWGELMFEKSGINTNDKMNGWDGTFNGQELPPDVYVYMVEAYCENDELLKLKGDVTIIR